MLQQQLQLQENSEKARDEWERAERTANAKTKDLVRDLERQMSEVQERGKEALTKEVQGIRFTLDAGLDALREFKNTTDSVLEALRHKELTSSARQSVIIRGHSDTFGTSQEPARASAAPSSIAPINTTFSVTGPEEFAPGTLLTVEGMVVLELCSTEGSSLLSLSLPSTLPSTDIVLTIRRAVAQRVRLSLFHTLNKLIFTTSCS